MSDTNVAHVTEIICHEVKDYAENNDDITIETIFLESGRRTKSSCLLKDRAGCGSEERYNRGVTTLPACEKEEVVVVFGCA